MNITLKQTIVMLVSATIATALPLFMIVYYRLRLSVRHKRLVAKIHELQLELQYLIILHPNQFLTNQQRIERHKLQEDDAQEQREFNHVFVHHFNRDYGASSYVLPFLLTLSTSVVFGLIYYDTLMPLDSLESFAKNSVLLMSIAGAVLYVVPSYIGCYAATSLHASNLYTLLFKLWLSVALGVATASLPFWSGQPVPAFLGALLPVLTLELLRDNFFIKQLADQWKGEDKEPENIQHLMKIIEHDESLLAQLGFMGIRSVRSLAYEYPLRIFLETDLNFAACLDIVDRAMLLNFFPKEGELDTLNRFGIRTAVDLMTQLYDDYGDGLGMSWRSPTDPHTPPWLTQYLTALAEALCMKSVDVLYNIIAMMRDDPQLRCLFDLWDRVDAGVRGCNLGKEWDFEVTIEPPQTAGQASKHEPEKLPATVAYSASDIEP